MRFILFSYGAICYAFFLAIFLYAAGFIGGFAVPKDLDDGTLGSVPAAVGINAALLLLFAVQHTIMARPAFKARWTKIIPAPVERSTFVLATCICFGLLFAFWRPLPDTIWHFENSIGRGVIYGVYGFGVVTVLLSTFAIGHFELFGLAQVWRHLRRKEAAKPAFVMPWLYRQVRHPIMLGFVIMVWATPTMSLGHLVFAIGVTGYILVGIQFEERDLRREHPTYDDYRREVPMLLPVPRKSAPAAEERRPA